MGTKKEIREKIRQLEDQGFTVVTSRSTGRHHVYLDGEWVTTLPGNPKEYRSIENSLRPARRLGFRD